MPFPTVDIEAMYAAGYADGAEARRLDTDLARARARDAASFDNRVVGAVIAAELLRADNPSELAERNAAVRNPTTLEHYPTPAPTVTKTS